MMKVRLWMGMVGGRPGAFSSDARRSRQQDESYRIDPVREAPFNSLESISDHALDDSVEALRDRALNASLMGIGA